jgi:hypothetical protein
MKALLELPLTLIHKTDKRRQQDAQGESCFRGFPKHSYGMLYQVDTLGRGVNGLGNHPESPTQGPRADVNFTHQIDMRYKGIDGSLERLYAVTRLDDDLEAKPWIFPALF